MIDSRSPRTDGIILRTSAVLGAGVALYALKTYLGCRKTNGETTCDGAAAPVRAPRPHELRLLDGDEPLEVPRAKRPLHFVIVGGGPGGALAACFLAKAGHEVDLLERDTEANIAHCAGIPLDHAGDSAGGAGDGSDDGAVENVGTDTSARKVDMGGGKATGVTLYPRGCRALRACLSNDDFDRITVPLIGRTLHLWNDKADRGMEMNKCHTDKLSARQLVLLDAHPFRHRMYTINRPGAQLLCLRQATRYGARVHYGARVVGGAGIDVEAATVRYTVAAQRGTSESGVPAEPTQHEIKAHCIVGADGAFSCVREAFVRDRVYCVDRLQVRSFSHGWKRVRLHDVLEPRDSPDEAGGKGGAGAECVGNVVSASGRLRHDTMHLWPLRAPANGIVISCPQANGNGLDCAIVMPHGPAASRAAGEAYTYGPWHLERLNAGGRAAVAQFFDSVLPEMKRLDDSVVDQFTTNMQGRFCSASISPYHYNGKLVLIGDAAHAMTGFWGQGMNMALEDGWRLAMCITAAEQDIEKEQQGKSNSSDGMGAGESSCVAHLQHAFERFSAERAASGEAIVQMSMKHLIWFTNSIGSNLYRWRQSYQKLMHDLFPSLFYPPLQHIVHFYDLSYAEMSAIEEEQAKSWSLGAL